MTTLRAAGTKYWPFGAFLFSPANVVNLLLVTLLLVNLLLTLLNSVNCVVLQAMN